MGTTENKQIVFLIKTIEGVLKSTSKTEQGTKPNSLIYLFD